jgi:hypothetical protein
MTLLSFGRMPKRQPPLPLALFRFWLCCADRNNLHNLVASLLQLTKNVGKGGDGLLMDVMKKHNSLTFVLNPRDGALLDLGVTDPFPVVPSKIRTPCHCAMRAPLLSTWRLTSQAREKTA